MSTDRQSSTVGVSNRPPSAALRPNRSDKVDSLRLIAWRTGPPRTWSRGPAWNPVTGAMMAPDPS